MSWRLGHAEFEKNKGQGNKKKMKDLVRKGDQIGIIAYRSSVPMGWCSIAPREKFIKLENSRVLKKIDDQPVWSITCFFLAKEFRRKGYSVELLKGVIDFCRKKRVKILEGYPVLPYSDDMPGAFAWTGFPASFKRAGFKVAKRWSRARPIMRAYL